MTSYSGMVFLIITSLFCFFYAMYFMQHKQRETSAVPFAAANFFMGVWNLLRAVKQMLPPRYYLSIGALTYLVIELSAYTLFWFSYRYSVPVDRQNKKVEFLPLLFPAATVVALMVEGKHLFALVGTRPLHLWDYLHTAYGYILMTAAAVLFIVRCASSFRQNKKSYLIIAAGVVLFGIQNVARYLQDLGFLAGLGRTIVLFYDAGVFFMVNLAFIAMYIDVNESLIAECKETLFERTDFPLFVFSLNNDFLVANDAARKMMSAYKVELRQYVKYDEVFPPEEFRRLGVPQNDSDEQLFYLSNVRTGVMYFCTKQTVHRRHTNKVLGYCFTLFDLDSYNMLFKNMETNAYSDQLTGCPNSSSFFMNARSEMQVTYEQRLLAVAGLDNLSEVNAVLGHQTGDKYIQKCSELLKEAIPDCIVYRMESSTFAVLLPASRIQKLPEVFGNVRSACSRYSSGRTCPLVISMGYTVMEDRNVDVNEYYTAAYGNMLLDRRSHSFRQLPET